MDKVSLLDRTDIKFFFHRNKLGNILQEAIEFYRILEVKGMRYADYDTNYFDTENYKFYHDHHNKRASRYKVRMRSYVNSDLHFFEIKYKSNKGRTKKSRITISQQDTTIKDKAADLLQEITGMYATDLQRAIQITSKRTTLVNKGLSERVTVDYDMKYQMNGQWHSFPDLVIIEVKQDKSEKSDFIKIMRGNRILPRSLSKYCFGIASFAPRIKRNNFKSKIIYVNKLFHQNAI